MTTSAYRVVLLTKGYVAVVSQIDARRVNKYEWHVHMSRGTKKKPGQPYARTNINGKKVYLHRFIMGDIAPDMQVDHRNHQTLDCRRENLEVVPHIVNQHRRRDVRVVRVVLDEAAGVTPAQLAMLGNETGRWRRDAAREAGEQ